MEKYIDIESVKKIKKIIIKEIKVDDTSTLDSILKMLVLTSEQIESLKQLNDSYKELAHINEQLSIVKNLQKATQEPKTMVYDADGNNITPIPETAIES